MYVVKKAKTCTINIVVKTIVEKVLNDVMVNFIHSILGFKKMSPPQKIASSFLLLILSGTFCLMLPIANQDNQMLPFLDALFSATSATCVTGLTITDISTQFTLFGQCILLLLIQVGGLGLMTLMAVFILIIKNKLSMNEKIAMKEMLNQDKVINMRSFIIDILYYTLFFEAIGAILIAMRMIPSYGLFDGGFKAIFLSISAFCNAGFDTLGTISLEAYVHDPLMMLTIMILIFLGGIGFAVWFDVRDKISPLLKWKMSFKKFINKLTLHSKVVLATSAFLILVPGLLIMLLEFNNPNTMDAFTLPQKLLSSLFEAVALRTAGFTSINYAGLHIATSFLMIILMFIGGSPGGTAGGIKTTTFAVLVIYMFNMLKGRNKTNVLHRTLPVDIVKRAMGIFFINLVTLFTGVFLLCIFEKQSFIALSYEAASAMGTVGSSLGITNELTSIGRIVIILLMYVGRIGISTLILSLMRKKHADNNNLIYPDGNIIVG